MKDSDHINMDVKVNIRPKSFSRIASFSETNAADSRQEIPPSFRHPSEKVMDCLRRFFRYNGPSQNSDLFHNSLIAGLSRYSGLPENHIHTFSETSRALQTIIKTFAKSGDSVLICRPVDEGQFAEGVNNNIGLSYYDGLTPFMTDPQGIIDSLSDNTGLIYLTNPNRCIGTVYSIDEIETIIAQAPNVRIILDETYYEYYGTSLVGLIRQYGNLIVIRSFSAAFGLGDLPCSYILSGPENIAAIKRTKPQYNPSPAAQVAAAAVLGDFEYLKQHIGVVRENMTYLAVRLRGLGIQVHTTPADFLLLNVANPVQVASRLRAEKIKVRDISHLARLQNYIAIPISDDTYSARIVEAFIRMPKQFYHRRQEGRRLILHRPKETKSGKVGIEEPECV